jgi:hypothetical protein
MNDEKVSAYCGLLKVTKKQYIVVQSVVFLILTVGFVLSYTYELDKYVFGNIRLFIVIVALLEIVEMIYIFRKFR